MLTVKLSDVGARALQTRWFVRAPIWLFRARLGFLMGSRILLLEHTGRISGKARTVVLEVVAHPDRDVFVIVSGFGDRAQWYRNVRAQPAVHVSSGFRRHVPARATALDPDESAAMLRQYATAHPASWKFLKGAIEKATGDVQDLPMVRLDLGNP